MGRTRSLYHFEFENRAKETVNPTIQSIANLKTISKTLKMFSFRENNHLFSQNSQTFNLLLYRFYFYCFELYFKSVHS